MDQTDETAGIRGVLEDAEVLEAAELEGGGEGADEGRRMEAHCSSCREGFYEVEGEEEGGLEGCGGGEGGEGVGDPGGFGGSGDVCGCWGGVVAECGWVVDDYFLLRRPEGVGDDLSVVRYYSM